MPQALSYFFNAVGTIVLVRVLVLVIEEGKKLDYDYAHAHEHEEKVHDVVALVIGGAQ